MNCISLLDLMAIELALSLVDVTVSDRCVASDILVDHAGYHDINSWCIGCMLYML